MTEFETMEKAEELEIEETLENAVIVVDETETKKGLTRKEKLLCMVAGTFIADIVVMIGTYAFSRIQMKKMLSEIEECSDETAEENE